MELTERLLLFVIGALVGFVFGWIVATVREVREELDRIDTATTGQEHVPAPKRGLKLQKLRLSHVWPAVVVALVAYAAFSSGAAAEKSEEAMERVVEQQEVNDRITYCNQHFLIQTIADLNARTTYTVDQAQSNVKLQRAQLQYLTEILSRPPLPDADLFAALQTYVARLTAFVQLAEKAVSAVESNPFATEEEVAACFDGTQIPEPVESTTTD